MAYADLLRSAGTNANICASLTEGIFSTAYATPLATWSPTFTGGAGTWSPSSGKVARYLTVGKMVMFYLHASATLSGTTTAYVTFTLPLAKAATSTPVCGGGSIIPDGSNVKSAAISAGSSTTVIQVLLYNGGNLTNGTVTIDIYGMYEVA